MVPVHPSLVVQGQNPGGSLLLEGIDQSLQHGDTAADQLGCAQGFQSAPILLVVLHDQVIDANRGVAVTHIEAAA